MSSTDSAGSSVDVDDDDRADNGSRGAADVNVDDDDGACD
jgi:hypothetical protein